MKPRTMLKTVTAAELRLKAAQFGEKAAQLRERQAAAPSTTPAALALAREVRACQQRAEDYELILAVLAERGLI
jgi:thioredoxin-like negative regulator of GroEL